MDFAKKELMKYGWSEGKGLGREENGIVTAIKPKLKFDTVGLGKDLGEQFTHHWWQHAFNSAAKNIDVSADKKGKVKLKTKGEFKITTKKFVISKENKDSIEYGSFLKKSTLIGNQIHEEKKEKEDESITEIKVPNISDEELYKICGGRTVHKSARHGHSLNGKLSRIEEQEKKMLENLLKGNQMTNEETIKKKKKKRKHNEDILEETEEIPPNKEEISPSIIKKKKKKSKKCKS